MNPKVAKASRALSILILGLVFSGGAIAQITRAGLSGIITDPSGAVVPNAKVSVKNVATEQSVETQTDSGGRYNVPNLVPGDYELSVSATGYSTNTVKVTIAAGPGKTVDMTLGGVLSLGDLGFSPTQTQGSAQDQARLDKRSHMLKIHQTLGLITVAPLAATLILSNGAAGKNSTASGREIHAAVGSVTAGMYLTAASFAIFAPKIPATKTRGQIRLHKALALIHGPGMILTPILGALAYDQRSRGEKVHGIASAHGAVGAITGIAYGAAMLSVVIKF